MKTLKFETRTYFDTGNAINPYCLKIMPMEPKRKLQRCKISWVTILSRCGNLGKSPILGLQEEPASQRLQIGAFLQRDLAPCHSAKWSELFSVLRGGLVDKGGDQKGQGILQAWHYAHWGHKEFTRLRHFPVVGRRLHTQLLWKHWRQDCR